jgi:hypothetical protein
MKRTVLLTVLALSICPASKADVSFVLGRALTQYDDVHIAESAADACPRESICTYGWSRWTLFVNRTVGGPLLKGRVHVATLQHSSLDLSFLGRLRQFALEYIPDASERQRLHADYKMLAFSEPSKPPGMYCTSIDPTRAGIAVADYSVESTQEYKRYCFDPRLHLQR